MAPKLRYVSYFSGGTSRKAAGSIPDGVVRMFYRQNPSGRTMALGSTQPLTEGNTRNISGSKGGRCVGLRALPSSCTNCLEIWEPQPPPSHGLSMPVQGMLCLYKSGSLNLHPLTACQGMLCLYKSSHAWKCAGTAVRRLCAITDIPIKVNPLQMEADSVSASEEFTHILWNPNVPDPIHNSLPLQLILSQINPFHDLLFYFFKTRFNIIFPSWSLSSKLNVSVDCLTKTLYTFLFSP
jgi:hypothetical protein